MTKFVGEQPFANADLAARQLVDFANATEVIQDGRIYIELINAQFLKAGGTAPRPVLRHVPVSV